MPTVKVASNDNYMLFRLRYIVDYHQRRSTVDLLTARIIAALQGSWGAVELASETIQLVDFPPIDVRLPPSS